MYYSNSVPKRNCFVLVFLVGGVARENKKSYFGGKNIYFYMKILLSWIGRQDLTSAQNDNDAAIAVAIEAIKPEKVVLLNNFEQKEVVAFTTWLNKRFPILVELLQVKLSSPTRHEEIYPAVLEIVKAVRTAYPEAELYFHLSPGTPAMHAVWLLIAKTQIKAQLIETTAETGFRKVELPFDISLDFYPDLKNILPLGRKLLTAEELSLDPDFQEILFKSDVMTGLFNHALTAAGFDIPVLIEGETGTGKEVLANLIHKKSNRREKPFIALNCGAIAKDIVESELFGYVKGAFTGANYDRKGFFEAADGGTIFLDEIADLPLDSQVKILRILNDGTFTKVGSPVPHKIDVRVVAATHKSLYEQVKNGYFREDLFYRLAVVYFEIPPLRDRRDDLRYLIESLFEKLALKLGKSEITLSAEAKNLLLQQDWRGNTRELINTLQRILIFTEKNFITKEDVGLFKLRFGSENKFKSDVFDDLNIHTHISKVFKTLYESALQKSDKKKEIALLMGFENHQTLDNWIKRYYKKRNEK